MDEFKVNKKGVLDSYSGKETVVIIPEGVKKIGSYAFVMKRRIVSVKLPSSVTQISDGAFSGCSSLEEFLAAESNIKKIGDETFAGCEKLRVVELPKTVKDVSANAFKGCKAMANDDGQLIYNGVLISYFGSGSEVHIDDEVHTIADDAFKWCETIERVFVPEGVTSIGAYAFCGCNHLKELVLSTRNVSIAEFAFANCPKLADQQGFFILDGRLYGYYGEDKNVTLPDGVQHIEPWAFRDCQSIERITIPDSVITIGNNAFWGCNKLQAVILPDQLNLLEHSVFAGCSSLSEIKLPSSLQSIGTLAFYSCEGITDLVIPNSVTSIGENAFQSCKQLRNVLLPNGLTSLGDGAFKGCESLIKVHIPVGITEIGFNMFLSCGSLQFIEAPSHLRKCFEDYGSRIDITYYDNGQDSSTKDNTLIVSDDHEELNVIRIECNTEDIEGVCRLLEELLAHFYLQGAGFDDSKFEKVLEIVRKDDGLCNINIIDNVIWATVEDGIEASSLLTWELCNENVYKNEFDSIACVGEGILKKYPSAIFSVTYQMQGISESIERVWTEDGEIQSEFLD